MTRRLIAAVTTIGLSAAGLAGASTAAAAPSAPSTGSAAVAAIAWGACEDPGLASRDAECALLDVPLDHDDPGGEQIQIAVSRIQHTVPDEQYQGVMLVNPGGPGGSGLTLSVLGEFVPNGAGAAYDWIGFDPRGVGSSLPALSCIPDVISPDRPDYIPYTRRLERIWLDRSSAYAAACATNGGKLLDHLKTTDNVADMESIREALGAEQINYYGFSYGTYLGQVYATLHPDRVRRMVLDANVDPRKVWYQANLDQDVAWEPAMDAWFAWLATYDSVYHLGRTAAAVEVRWYIEQTKLRFRPAGGVVGPDEFTDIFLYAGYYQFLWEPLADGLAAWVNDRDADALIGLYEDFLGPGDDNGYAIYLGTECTDAPWPRDWSTWRIDNWRTFLRAPFLTWSNAWFNAPCAFWAAPAGQPVDVDGTDVAPILLISQTLDAATPYEGSLEVRARFPEARLIAEPGGTTHAGSLGGNACVDDQIAAYLADGTLPARQPGRTADALCDPLPEPVPAAAQREARVQQAPGGLDEVRRILVDASRP